MTELFEALQLGEYELANRVVMAPLTRARAGSEGIANELMAEYYGQRASAGLIITEATAVSKQGLGWLNAPGIYTDEQQAGWKLVADAVHNKGGRIFMQLWHMGGIVHSDFLDGELPVSSSPVKLEGALTTPQGRDREFVVPRALTTSEIKGVVQDFVVAAKRAVAAGIDGVEIHAANGFLIDQFIRDGVNQREDEYGGSVDNRLRFMMEVVEAVSAAIGAGKTGIRLSPTNKVWGIADSDPHKTFSRAAERLNDFGLAYVHILEPKLNTGHPIETVDYLTPVLRKHYKGTLIINGGLNLETGQAALASKTADAIAYGSPFISNPDLVERFQQGSELTPPDPSTFYSDGPKGYTDYPRLVA